MNKSMSKIQQKSVAELNKDLAQLRSDITKITVESRLAPQKDSNLVTKKRKEIARILTVMNQKGK